MARQLRIVDVSDQPDVLRMAEEVRATREPRLLRRDGEDLAMLTPVRRPRRPPSRARPLTRDDALFRLIGIAEGSVPGGVSGKKHEYLARAYRHS